MGDVTSDHSVTGIGVGDGTEVVGELLNLNEMKRQLAEQETLIKGYQTENESAIGQIRVRLLFLIIFHLSVVIRS